MNFGKFEKKLTWHAAQKNFFKFLTNYGKSLIFVLLLSLLIVCIYIWYDNIYAAEWSQEEKLTYIKNKDKEVIFNKEGFDSIVRQSSRRYEASKNMFDSRTDIFRLKR